VPFSSSADQMLDTMFKTFIESYDMDFQAGHSLTLLGSLKATEKP